jgi:hypothetical protein
MMPKRRHLILVAPQSSDEDRRVGRIRTRHSNVDGARLRKPVRGRDPNISSVLSLAKYERGEDDYRHRMIMNGLAFVVTAVLIVAGVWLAANIHE